MRFLSRLRRGVAYESGKWLESEHFPGVRYCIRRMSLRQRIELASRVRELTMRHEFLRAGNVADEMEATLADLMVQRLYLEWAVTAIEGLTIDGDNASLERLIERGPEELSAEMIGAIRQQLELTDDERKN